MLASTAIREIRRAGLGAESVTAVGSVRRFSPDIGDVSLLGVVQPSRQRSVLKAFGRLPIVTGIASETPCSVTVGTGRGDITLHVTAPEHAGAGLVWHTGSRAHVDQLRQRADRLGLQLAGGKLSRGADCVTATTEEDVYAQLDLPYIPPEVRSGEGEISAAERGELPRLLAEVDIRGDLHMHSTWSDGRNTIADMVSASKQIGYEYVAITDHSERAWSSRKLAAADVPRQRDEIEALRGTLRGIEVLHGIEVDIMHNGSLDFDDELLEEFDIVLASLHDHGGHDGEWLTERYLRAMRNPYVNVITHPAGRAPAQSPGYEVDFDRLFATAVETGTAMEIDGAPGHLDMDGAVARRAVAAGVTLVVDSDCHRVDALGRQMRFGVGTARRGWIEPHHVLNTRSVADVRAFVARKRARVTSR
jgi:DNA polymerase (family 10)